MNRDHSPNSTGATMPDSVLPWDQAQVRESGNALHLHIAWDLEEPDRIGEATAITQASLIGRGGARGEDDRPRAIFQRLRPGVPQPAAPLHNSRISRRQLEIEPKGEGALYVRRVGRCAMLHNGVRCDEAVLQPGDTLSLRNAVVFLVAAHSRLYAKCRSFPSKPYFPFGQADPYGMVGESAALWELREHLALAAQSSHHVLLQGQSGVGKELAANAIHRLSTRRSKGFVSRNAATLPASLLDAELFGNARNYPNSGMPERPGLIGEADGSTLFLDELGELPESHQAHLLRVLDQDGEYQRLGESKTRKSDLRLVAATNRPLQELKHDFLARFTTRIRIPGLGDRRSDIPLFIRAILAHTKEDNPALAQRYFETQPDGRSYARMDPELICSLLRHNYTHHVRELARLLWLAMSTSGENYLKRTPQVDAELQMIERVATVPVSDIGRKEIEDALAKTKGSATQAAKLLGLKNRYVLYRLMKKFGVAPQGDTKND